MAASIGIIGAGTIGKEHAQAAIASDIEVKYVADVNLTPAQELASMCGAKPIDNIETMLSDDTVAGVVVAVPNALHRPLAIQSLCAGKDVLLEKPMAMNVAECEEINAAAANNERFVQVGLVNRYSSVGHSAKRFIDAGRLGEVYHAKALFYRRRGVPGLGGWFTTKAISGGGATIDLGVHVIDLALYLLGFPQVKQVLGKVYGKFGCRMEDYIYESMWAGPPRNDGVCDVDDSSHAMILFENGACLDMNVTWAGHFPDGSVPESMMGFFGDHGGMTFQLFGDHLLLAEEDCRHNVDKKIILPERQPFVDQITDFVTSIATREVRGATGAEATMVQSIIDAVYESSARGEAVRVTT